MLAWRGGLLCSEEFLPRLRSAYANALPDWGPWKKTFQYVASNFGLFVEDVAYTNLAKCWQTLDRTPIGPVRACARQYPLRELASILRPHGIVVLGGSEIELLVRQYGPTQPVPVVIKMRWSYGDLAAGMKRL